ncbi:AraC family transcriptional regulator [Mangrovibacterium marinum]|uniref:AraC family transcriptional regulator n=1 Tax=Mangrovibacterium marinum TaxID=1639118 RepID=UPI002A18B92B|nr:AraC family transcriptional regulator [Mangrovibacterium marinum]
MKIMHEQLSFQGKNSLNIKWDEFPHFTFPWHFHSEFELVYVLESFGIRFVADHSERFDEGDLILLGPNIPHYWKNDEVFFNNNPEYKVNAIVIHFPADFFKSQIDNYPEFLAIKKLFKRATRGIKFSKTTASQLDKEIRQLLKFRGLNLILATLKVLDGLAHAKNTKQLASESYRPQLKKWNGTRIEKIMHLINTSYRQQMTLEDIAREIGMNPTAFSRYFKEKTGKNFIRFINEMRIGYACKLLQENQMNIADIGYECGFRNLSNFNRFFKDIVNQSPRSYQKHFLAELDS